MIRVLLLLFCFDWGFSQEKTTSAESVESILLVRQTMRLLDGLELKKLDHILHLFDSGIEKKGVKSLQDSWLSLLAAYGKLNKIQQISTRYQDYKAIVFCRLVFERQHQGLKIIFGPSLPRKVVHLEFIDPKLLPEQDIPVRPYVKPWTYTVEPLLIGPDAFPLQGKIFRPKETDDPQWLIFLHDFGPQSLTHRTGLNDFFLDMAEGLASNGIACILYPKRSYLFSPEQENTRLNPVWEVLNDLYFVQSAIRTNLGQPKSRIYVASYGFSSWFLPFLAKKQQFHGYILMNPSFRHPLQVLFEREEFHQARSSGPTNELLALSNKISAYFGRDLQDSETLFGYPVGYFKALDSLKPDALEPSDTPFLVLMAKNDYIYNPADEPEIARIFKNSRMERQNFDDLNRIFQVGNKLEPDQDFYTPGIVSANVILNMLTWLKAQ